MRLLTVTTALCAVAPFLNAYAQIPTAVEASLKAAMATGDAFVIEATRAAAAARHPKMATEINAYGTPAAVAPAPVAPAPVAVTAKDAPQKKNWSGEVELGFDLDRGNTNKRDVVSNGKLHYDINSWRHTLTAKANSSFENSVRTEEDYRFGWQTAYDLNERQYVFGQAEYINDMFSGYNYRITEDFGYGHYILKNDKMVLKAQAGVGGQHTEAMLANGREELTSEVIFKPLVGFNWKLNDRLDFASEARSTMGLEVVVSNFEASLKTSIAKNLAAKLSYELEHTNSVPVGTNKTDTTTALKLVYDF